MFAIIGIVVVFGAVLAGYLMEHGNMKVLMQPAELIIILGAAIGTVLVANPLHILTGIGKGIGGAFGGSPFTKQRYLDSLRMMYELFSRARKEGLMSLEADSDAPNESQIFSKYPKFLNDHHALAFVCDSLRMAASGGIEPFDADQMMELDTDVHHHGATQPVAALSTMADSLPGLGIVAAVLGVVITMGALGGPPEEIGKKVAAALVGTFLGILLVLRPGRAASLEHGQDRRRRACLLPRPSRLARWLTQGHQSGRSDRNWPPRDPFASPPYFSGSGNLHQGKSSRARGRRACR